MTSPIAKRRKVLNDITHEFNSSISSITNIDNGDDNDSNSDNTGSNKDNKDSNDETIESTDDTDDTDDIDNTDDSKTTNTDERDGNSDPAYKLFVPCGACGVSYRSTAFLDPNNRCNEVLCPRLLCDSCSRGPPYSCPVPTCLKAYCDRHFQQLRRIDTIRRCSLCDDPICGEHNHLDVCDICYRVFCLQCRVDLQRMHCRSCGNMYCGKCTGVQIMCAVPSCGKSYCRQCAESRIDASCMVCSDSFCRQHAVDQVFVCESCDALACKKHGEHRTCEECGDDRCLDCLSEVACSTNGCSEVLILCPHCSTKTISSHHCLKCGQVLCSRHQLSFSSSQHQHQHQLSFSTPAPAPAPAMVTASASTSTLIAATTATPYASASASLFGRVSVCSACINKAPKK